MGSYIPPPYSTLEGGSVLGGGAVIVVFYDKRHGERKVNLQMVNLRYRSLQSSSCHEKKASMIMITTTQGLMVLSVEREVKYLKSEESDFESDFRRMAGQ